MAVRPSVAWVVADMWVDPCSLVVAWVAGQPGLVELVEVLPAEVVVALQAAVAGLAGALVHWDP